MQFDSLRHLRWAFLVTPRQNNPLLLSSPKHPGTFGASPAAAPALILRATGSARARGACGAVARARALPASPGELREAGSARCPPVRAAAFVPRSAPGPARPLRPEGAHLRLSSSPAAVSAKFPGHQRVCAAPAWGVREAGRAGVEEGPGGGGRRVPGPTPARLPRPGPPACSRTDTDTARTPTAHGHRHTDTAPAATPEAPAGRPRVWPGSRGFFGMQGVAL